MVEDKGGETWPVIGGGDCGGVVDVMTGAVSGGGGGPRRKIPISVLCTFVGDALPLECPFPFVAVLGIGVGRFRGLFNEEVLMASTGTGMEEMRWSELNPPVTRTESRDVVSRGVVGSRDVGSRGWFLFERSKNDFRFVSRNVGLLGENMLPLDRISNLNRPTTEDLAR